MHIWLNVNFLVSGRRCFRPPPLRGLARPGRETTISEAAAVDPHRELNSRVDCLPEKGRSKDREECRRRGCRYDEVLLMVSKGFFKVFS